MPRVILAVFAAFLAFLISGCATPGQKYPNSTPEEVAAARYVSSEPPSLTLYTMINNRSDAGAHSSIMINAPSQRVIFDPAGSVRAKGLPEIDDVLYGVTPKIERFYARAHARETYRVRIQRIEVSPDVAEKALRLAQASGPVASAQCTQATSGLMKQLPGFEGIKQTWFPTNLADQLASYPGVSDRMLRENDADDKGIAIAQFESEQSLSNASGQASQ